MEKRAFAVGLIALSGTALAAPITPPNIVDETSQATLEAALGVTLAPIDLTAQPIASTPGLNAQNNVLTSVYSAAPFYSGTLTSEVLANTSVPGVGVSDVVIKYTFLSDPGSLQAIDTFNFGAGTAIDFGDVLNARQGRITGVSSHLTSPIVTIDNGVNTTYDFDFAPTGALAPNTSLTWYVAADGAVKVNVVDVVITDFGNTTAKALVFTTTGGQDDLNVPTPATAAFAGFAGLVAFRRRR